MFKSLRQFKMPVHKKDWKLIEFTTFIYISLNIIDIFGLHIFLLFLSNCRINLMISGGNCLINLP